MTPCDKCGCPLLLLERDRAPWIEKRKRCASCTGAKLAEPCPVRGCFGEAFGERGVRACRACRQERKREVTRAWQEQNRESVREANRRSYEAHAQERLEQRRRRRELEGEALRARERARYAAREAAKGRTIRPKPRKGSAGRAVLAAVVARPGARIEPGRLPRMD